MYFHAYSSPETSGIAVAAADSLRSRAPAKIRKFLVAFDGSPAALGALEHAVNRARVEGSRLHVVNVQDVLIGSDGMLQIHQERGERILEGITERLRPFKVPLTTEIAFGSPAAAIVRTAREEGCDHIVLGMTNRTGFASLFTPGVSREVVRFAEVPVTLIKAGEK